MLTATKRNKCAVLFLLAFLLNTDDRISLPATTTKCRAQENDIQSANTRVSLDTLLTMSVDLVASMDGGKLRAGTTGWVRFSLHNESDSQLTVPTAYMSAKAAGEKPRPSKLDKDTYFGFGIATLCYAFVRADDEAPPKWVMLPPPDDPLELKGRGNKRFWRFITAPKEPGVYELHLNFNNARAVEAIRSWNNLPPRYPTEPLSAKAHATGVEIIDGGQ